ncbi:hypothetical protein WN943_029123 [Citrus x changshan-huyou]
MVVATKTRLSNEADEEDLCSINFTTTRRSPSNASSPDVPAHTDKSEYAGCSPGANPPTLKSDMKASLNPRFPLFARRYGTLTAASWAKENVGSCVLRHGSGESVAVVPRFSGWRACLANCRRPGLLASRPLAGMTLCLLQEIDLTDDVLVDEQDISAPVPPSIRLLRNTPARGTLPPGICSPCLVSSTYFSETPVPQFLVLGNVVDQQNLPLHLNFKPTVMRPSGFGAVKCRQPKSPSPLEKPNPLERHIHHPLRLRLCLSGKEVPA